MVGAKLDRNGLRPLRYTLTADGLLVAGSEVGLADFRDKEVAERQRLGPGEMLLADPATGVIYRGNDVSRLLGSKLQEPRPQSNSPVRLAANRISDAPKTPEPKKLAAALGWTDDQFHLLFQPLG